MFGKELETLCAQSLGPEYIGTFKTELVKAIAPATTQQGAYALLRDGAVRAFDNAAKLGQSTETTDSQESQQSKDFMDEVTWDMIQMNIRFGTLLMAYTIRDVGHLYQANCHAIPQEQTRVTHNLYHMLGHIISFARSSEETTQVNFAAMAMGVDPRNTTQHLKLRRILRGQGASEILALHGLTKGIAVDVTDTGQLHLSPRYAKRLPPNTQRTCPLIHVKVGSVPDTTRSVNAMWLLGQTMADVAIEHIYPYQFPIISDLPERTDTLPIVTGEQNQ